MSDEPADDEERVVRKPTEAQQDILDAAAANPALTNAELAKKTDTRISLVRDTLREFDGSERPSPAPASDATAPADSPEQTADDDASDPAADPGDTLAHDDHESFDDFDDISEDIDPHEAFETVDVDEIDTDAVWEELLGAEADAATFDEDPTGELTASKAAAEVGSQSIDEDDPIDAVDQELSESEAEPAEPQDIFGDGEEALVDKRVYCQQCPHFSKPPAVHCDREETTIVEVLSDGRFRLKNCPVVTEEGPDRSYFQIAETPDN